MAWVLGAGGTSRTPAQLSSHAQAPRIAPATIDVAAPRTLDVPAGRFEGVPVTVVHDGGEDTFVFDSDVVTGERALARGLTAADLDEEKDDDDDSDADPERESA